MPYTHQRLSPLVYLNGTQVDQAWVSDRGLAFGDGVFETIRFGKQPVLLDLHLQRLYRGLKVLGILLELDSFEKELEAFLKAAKAIYANGVLKIMITRGSGGRGYACESTLVPTRIMSLHPLPEYPDSNYTLGVPTAICEQRLAANPMLAGIKHLNRLEQVLARREYSTAQFPELLVRDYDNHIIEGVGSNLFAVKSNNLYTPDLSQCGIEGTLRQWLIDYSKHSDISVNAITIDAETLSEFDELFLCNSVFGIWPICSVGVQSWSVGPLTRRLQLETNKLFSCASI